MGKKIVSLLIVIVISALSIVAGTLAFFTASTNSSKNTIGMNSNKFAVVFTSTGPIDGTLTLGTSKLEGLSTNVSLKMDDESVLSKANLFINVDDITDNKINNNRDSWKKALIWELYGYDSDNNQVLIDTGNFIQCGETGNKECKDGDELYMYRDFQLTYEYVNFEVYVWLDGNIADNGAKDAYVKASISAKTEDFSADLR